MMEDDEEILILCLSLHIDIPRTNVLSKQASQDSLIETGSGEYVTPHRFLTTSSDSGKALSSPQEVHTYVYSRTMLPEVIIMDKKRKVIQRKI